MNAQSIAVYEQHAERYASRQDEEGKPPQWWWDWLDDAWLLAARLVTDSRIRVLEIGSGPGRDADYLENAIWPHATVDRTDAAQAFVDYQRSQGHAARRLNVLEDWPLGEHQYEMVLAAAVFHHFTDDQARVALARMTDCLVPGGVLAFSQRRGDGEEFNPGWLGAGRYFRYRQPQQLWSMADEVAQTRGITYAPEWDGKPMARPWLMVTATTRP
jgi:SAM-dependent methyltransferase